MPMKLRAFRVSPVMRSVGVISAVAVLVGGVTFAALQSQATLTDNTVSSASANLLVDGNKDGTFSAEEKGFTFDGIVPGVTPSEAKAFALQNDGEVDLKVKAMVKFNATEEPTVPGASAVKTLDGEEGEDGEEDPTIPELPDGVEASDIVFTFKAEGGIPIIIGWDKLSGVDGKKILENLGAGDTKNMTVQVSIKGSVEASSVDIGSFDIVFTGEAASAPAPIPTP
jgi:hypothetical protein